MAPEVLLGRSRRHTLRSVFPFSAFAITLKAATVRKLSARSVISYFPGLEDTRNCVIIQPSVPPACTQVQSATGQAYDISTISSYSQCLKQVQYGKNKENDRLPQINLALVFGEQSNLPFYYRKLSGNTRCTSTI